MRIWRKEVVSCQLSQDEKARLRELAAHEGLSQAEMLRLLIHLGGFLFQSAPPRLGGAR
jgi:hypothetical protein